MCLSQIASISFLQNDQNFLVLVEERCASGNKLRLEDSNHSDMIMVTTGLCPFIGSAFAIIYFKYLRNILNKIFS